MGPEVGATLLVELAHHWREAGDRRALAASIRAGRAAMASFAFDIALGEYPPWSLVALLTAPPMLWKWGRLDATNPPKVYEELTRDAVVLHVVTALLITAGFLVSLVRV